MIANARFTFFHVRFAVFSMQVIPDMYGHNGLMNDCEIIFIDKPIPRILLERNFFWIRVLKTIAPLSSNIDEGYDY